LGSHATDAIEELSSWLSAAAFQGESPIMRVASIVTNDEERPPLNNYDELRAETSGYAEELDEETSEETEMQCSEDGGGGVKFRRSAAAALGVVLVLGFISVMLVKPVIFSNSSQNMQQTDDEQSALRFLSSQELAHSVSKSFAQANPICRQGVVSKEQDDCNEPAMSVAIRRQVSESFRRSPELSAIFNNRTVSGVQRQRLLSAAGHIFDARIPGLAREVKAMVDEHAHKGPVIFWKRLRERLAPLHADMKDLRSKLLPGVPFVDEPEDVKAEALAPWLGPKGVFIQDTIGGWRASVDVTFPQAKAIPVEQTTFAERRLYTMQAQGVAGGGWPRLGPRPPGDAMHDVVAVFLGLFPLAAAHIIQEHYSGEYTMAHWAKVVVTIELLVRSPFLLFIELVMECMFLWSERGYDDNEVGRTVHGYSLRNWRGVWRWD